MQKYILPQDDSIEFITSHDFGKRTFLLRSKKIFTHFLDQMIKQDQLHLEKRQTGTESDLSLSEKEKRNQKNDCRPNVYYSSSLSHQNFNRGAVFNNYDSSIEPSDASSDC